MKKISLLAAVLALFLSACNTTPTDGTDETIPNDPTPLATEVVTQAITTQAPALVEKAIAPVTMRMVNTNRPMLRGIWIASWGDGILTKEQCDELVTTCRESNLNAIFPEVRKIGDAYYHSNVEPRANNIPDDEFDPLGYLIEQCHDTSDGKQYIEVHAWLVTFRLWKGDIADVPEGHFFKAHPDAAMYNYDGEIGGFADPGHPATEEWTAKVFRDVATSYDVDGVHHDYVRYPEDGGAWGYNPVSLKRFQEKTRFEGKPAPSDPMWQAWRRDQVANVVRRVYAEVNEARPDCLVSAATLNWSLEMDIWDWQKSSPRLNAHQDWPRFMEEGTLDMNVLMNYTQHKNQPKRFPDWTDLALRTRNDRHAIIGPGVYLNTVDDSMEQIRMAIEKGADGVNLYDWGTTNKDKEPRAKFFKKLREEIYTERAEIPARPWKETPNYGTVMGIVNDEDGNPVDGAAVVLDAGRSMLTSGTGFYAFFRVAPGKHSLEIRPVNDQRRGKFVNVRAGNTVRANLEM
jgi:uncharacterized lipoprotein YddW (UPF0748 family)